MLPKEKYPNIFWFIQEIYYEFYRILKKNKCFIENNDILNIS